MNQGANAHQTQNANKLDLVFLSLQTSENQMPKVYKPPQYSWSLPKKKEANFFFFLSFILNRIYVTERHIWEKERTEVTSQS